MIIPHLSIVSGLLLAGNRVFRGEAFRYQTPWTCLWWPVQAAMVVVKRSKEKGIGMKRSGRLMNCSHQQDRKVILSWMETRWLLERLTTLSMTGWSVVISLIIPLMGVPPDSHLWSHSSLGFIHLRWAFLAEAWRSQSMLSVKCAQSLFGCGPLQVLRKMETTWDFYAKPGLIKKASSHIPRSQHSSPENYSSPSDQLGHLYGTT
jgi:hypothetical protein